MGAVDLFEQGGVSKAEIARRVGVSHQTVSDWHDVWGCKRGGVPSVRRDAPGLLCSVRVNQSKVCGRRCAVVNAHELVRTRTNSQECVSTGI